MAIKRKQAAVTAETDMTPMIDVTFQLIIFFMLVLNFAEADQNERIKLPASVLAKPPDAAAQAPLVLQVTKEGTVLFIGDEVSVEGMRPYLLKEQQLLERNDQSAADATVVIRGDALVPTGVVQELIRVCQEIGFENFILRARQEETEG